MNRVQELLSAYIAEHRRGGRADPTPYLGDLRGGDRAELAALIDHFLATADRGPFDAAAFERFRARPDVVAMSERVLDEPRTLAALRQRAGVRKQDLGRRLAHDLGLEDCAGEVKARYHDLETGTIDADRVRAGVWESLAAAFGETVAIVRAAAAGARPPSGLGGAFARSDAGATGAPVAEGSAQTDAQRRVDEVFLVPDDG